MPWPVPVGDGGAGQPGAHALSDPAVLLRPGYRHRVQRAGRRQHPVLPRYPPAARFLWRGGAPAPDRAQPHRQELSRHTGHTRRHRRVRCSHGAGGDQISGRIQPLCGRRRGEGYLVQDQGGVQRRQAAVGAQQRGHYLQRGAAGVPQHPALRRHRDRRAYRPVLSGLPGLFLPGSSAYRHRRHIRPGDL